MSTKTKSASGKEASAKAESTKSSFLYRCVSTGYDETFETKGEAIAQANYLKKRAVKSSEAVKIKVTEEDQHSGKSKVVHEVNIKDDFYK